MIKVIRIEVGYMKVNCYIVFNPDTNKAVVIDPGDDADYIISKITENSLQVEHIILTHAHFDHIMAVDRLCDEFKCDIIMNKGDFEYLTEPKYNLSSEFPLPDVVIRNENVRFVGDETLGILDDDFSFIHTPGHSKGSMCICVGELLFTGDTLFKMSVGNDFPPFGSLLEEISSIVNKLYSLDGDYICYPGHGENTTLDFERRNNPYTRTYEN